jgi:hypothetical protein
MVFILSIACAMLFINLAVSQTIRTHNGSLVMEIPGASFTLSGSSSSSCGISSYVTQADMNSALATNVGILHKKKILFC